MPRKVGVFLRQQTAYLFLLSTPICAASNQIQVVPVSSRPLLVYLLIRFHHVKQARQLLCPGCLWLRLNCTAVFNFEHHVSRKKKRSDKLDVVQRKARRWMKEAWKVRPSWEC